MAWYRSGTVSLTNGSATVTGSGTAFIANVSVGEGFLGPDGRTYEITDIASNTSLTISPMYMGSTASGQAYAIAPLRGRIADLIAETSSLLASFSSVRDGIGAGLFPGGSAAAPAFRFSSDQDTGVYSPGANQFAVSTGGQPSLIANADGSVSLRARATSSRAKAAEFGRWDDGAGNVFALDVHDFDGKSIGWMKAGRFGADFHWTHDSGSGEVTAQRFGMSINNHFIDVHGPNADNGVKSRISGTGDSFILGSLGIGTADPSGYRLNVVKGSQGNVAQFSDGIESTFVIRTQSGVLQIGQANNLALAVLTNGLERMRIAANGDVLAGSDNVQSLGGASNRWSVIYAGTGTINTSDEREKTWRGALTADELRAAKRIIGELGIYQWNDAIAEKGADDARLHFGVRAQQVFAIMEDEGLDWQRYAWCCFDEWDEQTEPELDEDGEPTGETIVTVEAGDRYGIRPDQLAFWLIAAQAAMQANLEARIAALEAA